MWWIFGGKFCVNFPPGKIGLKFVTENFSTFFTARKDICHLELTLGASSPNYFSLFGGGGGLLPRSSYFGARGPTTPLAISSSKEDSVEGNLAWPEAAPAAISSLVCHQEEHVSLLS